MQLLGLIDCAVLLLSLATMVLVLFVAMARYFLIVGYVWYASVKTDNYPLNQSTHPQHLPSLLCHNQPLFTRMQ